MFKTLIFYLLFLTISCRLGSSTDLMDGIYTINNNQELGILMEAAVSTIQHEKYCTGGSVNRSNNEWKGATSPNELQISNLKMKAVFILELEL